MKVGFIGVGNMGGPMCRNIIRNTNHDVVVFDLNPAAIKACTDLGATAGASVARGRRRLRRGVHLAADAAHRRGGRAGRRRHRRAAPGPARSTSISPPTRRPPRGGSTTGCGPRASRCWRRRSPAACRARPTAPSSSWWAATRRCSSSSLPLLKSFSGEVVHVGEIGMGSVAKLVNNMLAFCNAAAAAEALMIGSDVRHRPAQAAAGDQQRQRQFLGVPQHVATRRSSGEFQADLRARPRAQGPAARAGDWRTNSACPA